LAPITTDRRELGEAKSAPASEIPSCIIWHGLQIRASKVLTNGATPLPKRLWLAFPAPFAPFVRELAPWGLRFFGSFFLRKKKEQK